MTRSVIRAGFAAGVAVAVAVAVTAVEAQNAIYKAPTPADWAALAKLPDFSGVWEIGRAPAPAAAPGPAEGRAGGAPGRTGGAGRGGAPAAPQLTPAAEAKRKELAAKAVQDNETAN